MALQDAYNSAFSVFHSVREYLSPVLRNSKFKETGQLTPEEFVAAGDFLVYKCPTWTWESGDPGKRRDFLPADKQYLVTRNVPCLRRAKQIEYTDDDAETQLDMEDDGETWMFTHSSRESKKIDDIAHIPTFTDDDEEAEAARTEAEIMRINELNLGVVEDEEVPEEIPDMDDLPEIDDEDLGELIEAEDSAALTQEDASSSNLVIPRTYDVHITYDKYYQTPRLYLMGYSPSRAPLTTKEIFEDVNQDYAKKTVTIEQHPHLSVSLASIHPCRHAQVMRRIIERASEGKRDEADEIRVDQYLVIFLKFMSSVIPTIDYDYTIST